MFDEKLLALLDEDEEVRRDGRSAVVRRAAAHYLRQKHRAAIAEQYRRAYGGEDDPLADFAGWEDEGAWPHE